MEQVLVSCFSVLEGLVAALAADDDVVHPPPLANDGYAIASCLPCPLPCYLVYLVLCVMYF